MPREFPEAGQIEFAGRVTKADYDEFIGRFPVHGATTWFIRTALSNFLNECRANPTLDEVVTEAIHNMTSDPFNMRTG